VAQKGFGIVGRVHVAQGLWARFHQWLSNQGIGWGNALVESAPPQLGQLISIVAPCASNARNAAEQSKMQDLYAKYLN
jgi:hypothetical protein